MADDLFGKIFGEEDERPDVPGAEAIAGAEAFAAAIAAIASRQDPGVARKTATFLDHQSRLLKIQADHLQDEHAMRLAGLREQSVDGRLRRASARVKLASQLITAMIVTALGIFLLVAISDAVRSRSVVIEPFETPPGLQADGLNGKVAATSRNAARAVTIKAATSCEASLTRAEARRSRPSTACSRRLASRRACSPCKWSAWIFSRRD